MAARKWLKGEAIPTQDKIHILARWIGVSPQWLRFGEAGDPLDETMGLDARDVQLAMISGC